MSFDKYSSIDNLYKVPDIFTAEEVVCTEKIHGCNFRVQLEQVYPGDWKITYGSRNHEVALGSNFYGDKPVRWFTPERLEELVHAAFFLTKGNGAPVTIYGEIFGSSIQRGVRYLPQEHDGEVEFRAFDVKVEDTFLDYANFEAFCISSGLPKTPVVYRGPPLLEKLNACLEIGTFVGWLEGLDEPLDIAEGVVIKPTREMKNSRGDRLIAKHKSEGFSERNPGKRPATQDRWPNLALAIAGQYVTRGRILNAIEKCAEGGIIVTDMSAMKYLPSVVYNDVATDVVGDDAYPNGDEKALRSAVVRQTGIELKKILNERMAT